MTEELHHMAAAYALDALDDDERRAFEAHYPSCAMCTDEVDDFRETAAELAIVVAVEPPAGLRDRVMADIAATRQIAPDVPDRVVDLAERRRFSQTQRRLLAAVAAAAIAVAGFVAGLVVAGSGERDGDQDVLVAADARTVELAGDVGTARVVWSRSEDAVVLIASGLGDPGDGMAYELWLIDADGPRATGLFSPDGDGAVRLERSLDGATPAAWGVTIEPDTGSDQPTGEILLIGEAP